MNRTQADRIEALAHSVGVDAMIVKRLNGAHEVHLYPYDWPEAGNEVVVDPYVTPTAVRDMAARLKAARDAELAAHGAAVAGRRRVA